MFVFQHGDSRCRERRRSMRDLGLVPKHTLHTQPKGRHEVFCPSPPNSIRFSLSHPLSDFVSSNCSIRCCYFGGFVNHPRPIRKTYLLPMSLTFHYLRVSSSFRSCLFLFTPICSMTSHSIIVSSYYMF